MATGSTVSDSARPQRKSQDKNGGKESTIKPRPYQLELLDACLNENTIVNLGTGAGKTFIAVMLIRELSHQILEGFITEGAQRTVFLVNTVPLVHQQSQYIKNHTHLEVGEYTGDMNVDSWPPNRWLREFDNHHVLVMTRAIFLALLNRGFVHLRKINLLVFDECHHAVKNDDYVQIMKVFDSCQNDIEVPRVLGLTASLIPSKCKPGDLETKIRALEETLRCRSQTAKDMDEVAKYATNPVEKTLHYSSSRGDPELRRILEGPLDFLNSFKKEQKTKVYDYVKLHLDDGLHILENLGIWCAHDFAKQALRDIERVVDEVKDVESRWENSLLYLGRTHLKIFMEKSNEKLEAVGRAEVPLTPKVQALLRHLGDSGISNGEVKVGSTEPLERTRARKKSVTHLLGIIFVERRTTAALLTKLLKQKSRDDPDLKHIKCEYIVGHNMGKGVTYVRREAHMSVKKQNEILEKFRKEKLNLLVATSVVEEGVDVPKCNLVVRFDFPQNLRSYIQSKGRARAKESTYLILIEKEKEAEVRLQLWDYQELEKELKRLCHNRDVPGEEDILKRMEEIVSPYMPFGREAGTRATLSSSLPLIHRYCQKLPSDRYTILAPIFKAERRSVLPSSESDHDSSATIPPLLVPGQEFGYRSTLILPMSCPVRTEIEGAWMPTRRIADKSAALEGVKQLHMAGELDDHLIPISKSMDSDEEDAAKMEEKRKPNAGTEKRACDYPNEVAPSLTNCFPVSGPGNHLYIFVVRDVESGNVYLGLPSENDSHTALGILTRSPLPHLKIPEFSIYDGEREVYVRVHKYHSLVAELRHSELEILQQCHKTIFTEILGIRATWLQPEFENAEKNYLVVPLGFLPDLDPMEAYIDMNLAGRVAEMGSGHRASDQPIEWPCMLEVFTNALVTGIHCPPQDRRLYEVVHVDRTTTPRSRFPDPKKAGSFAEYFKMRYDHSFRCLDQPALECKPVGVSASRLRLITSRFKTTEGEKLQKSVQKSEVKLFPEICTLYPLPANFWKLARCLPSILWRVECILLMDAFRSAVARDTGVGLFSSEYEVTTHTTLRGYKDYGFGELETQQFITTGKDEEVHILPNSDVPLRGPDNALLLQAMTPKGANDSINLERLETLGDSFLKLTTSVFLFCDRPHAHEGRLTSARSRRVGNFNLCSLAKQEEIDVTGKILSTGFEPREMWIPPCFSFNKSDPYLMQQLAAHGGASTRMPDQQRHYLYHRATDKGVADCAEALIGAYLVSGGIEAGLRFTKWMGVKMTKEGEPLSLKSTAEDASPKPPRAKRMKPSLPHASLTAEKAANTHLFFRNSSSILSEYFGPHPPTVLSVRQQLEVQRLLRVSSSSLHKLHSHKIEKRIDWTFHDPSLLLQALTHASYTKNRVTDCYQRLEFLGDAVLDYLITCNIYSNFPNYGPGEITGMRSALVNNITFAELAIQLELHKALLHNSPALFKQIPQYIEALKKLSPGDRMMEEEESTAVIESSEILCRDQDDSGAATASLPVSEPPVVEEEDSDEEVEELDPPKVLGDLLESLAGAVFLDSGMNLETVWRVFSPLFQSKIDKFEGKIPVPPIQELFELEPNIQTKRSWKKGGRVRCMLTVVDRGIQVSAEASSHKAAKSAAARAALKKIKAQT